MSEQSLITLTQLPIIEQRLKLISDRIDAEVAEIKALPVDDDTVKAVKKLRAAFNSDFQILEDRRKEVKRAIAAPYEEFNKIYEELISKKYKDGLSVLDAKVTEVEDAQKAAREAEVKRYYTEYAVSLGLVDIPYEAAGINMTLSLSEPKAKDQAKVWLQRRRDDIASMSTFDNGPELVAEYRKNGFDYAKAVQTVIDRSKAIEAEKAKQAEREALQEQQTEAEAKVDLIIAAQVPVEITGPDENEVVEVTFTIRDTRKKVRLVREFMDKEGVNYGK